LEKIDELGTQVKECHTLDHYGSLVVKVVLDNNPNPIVIELTDEDDIMDFNERIKVKKNSNGMH
jgi:hypothetical protein